MEIITMESAAYKDIVGRIEEIASHVRRQGMEGQRNDTACLLDSREVMRLLCVSRRTLQRLRDEKRIGYVIIRGDCRYPPEEVERIIRENAVKTSPGSARAERRAGNERRNGYGVFRQTHFRGLHEAGVQPPRPSGGDALRHAR